MSSVRVTLILSFTALVIFFGSMAIFSKSDRYIYIPQSQNTMFVVDRQTALINYCTSDKCQIVMPGDALSHMMPSHILGMLSSMGQGFQPYMMPGGNQMNTGMNITGMPNQNNPMMMPMNINAMMGQQPTNITMGGMMGGAGIATSLQSQPSYQNLMALAAANTTQSSASATAQPKNVQSPIVPQAMNTNMIIQKPSSTTPPEAPTNPSKKLKNNSDGDDRRNDNNGSNDAENNNNGSDDAQSNNNSDGNSSDDAQSGDDNGSSNSDNDSPSPDSET